MSCRRRGSRRSLRSRGTASRLLVLERATGALEDARFSDLPRWLRAGDCVVVNESRVIPARLIGALEGDGRPVELLMLRALDGGRWEALVRPGKRCGIGARVVARGRRGAGHGARAPRARARAWSRSRRRGRSTMLLERHGLPPLPPYIERHDAPKPEDWERYQTVYATEKGSVAAPTAGLHFTRSLLERVRAAGVEIHRVTLHVGAGTFRPIRSAEVEEHRLEPEIGRGSGGDGRGRQPRARRGPPGHRGGHHHHAHARVGRRRDRPGHARFAAAPISSSTPAIASASSTPSSPTSTCRARPFCSSSPPSPAATRVLDAYRHAVALGYRFYSYGDAMLIL